MRDIQYDIAKGIGIILVVMGHANTPGTSFIYLFHMALFFIISGYFYNNIHCQTLSSIFKYCKKQLKHLILPYILFSVGCILLNNYFIDINIFTDNPELATIKENYDFNTPREYLDFKQMLLKIFNILLLVGGSALCPALWFLRTLFYIVILYSFIYYILNKIIINKRVFEISLFFSILFCFSIGMFLQKIHFNFYNLGTIFSAILLFYIGVLIKTYSQLNNISFSKFILSFVLLIISFINNIPINLAGNKFPNVLILLLTSISGYYFIMYISKKIKSFDRLANILSYIGQNTISILILHFLAFKIINYIEIHIYNLPEYYLAATPIIYSKPLWWILYVIVGVVCPLLINYMWTKIKQILSYKNILKYNFKIPF